MSDLPFTPDPARALIFIVHGLGANARSVKELKGLGQACFPNGHVEAPLFAHKSVFSRQRAAQTVLNIIARIDAAYAQGDYEKVIIIGHSMGAVLARRAIIEASTLDGPDSDANVEPAFVGCQARPWAKKVDLLVMMASISRGWSLEGTKSPTQRAQWAFGAMIGHILRPNWRPTIFDFRRGSLFIAQTRLRWLEYCKAFPKERPRVVQVLGTRDDLAPPDDSIDFATSEGGEKFLQVEMPNSGHKDVMDLYAHRWEKQQLKENAARRYRILGAVLTADAAGYADHIIDRAFLVDELPPAPDPSILNLIFIMHGIRDRGFWAKKIAGRVKEKAMEEGVEFASRTPAYGYFPILPFLLPWYRLQKVEWLVDQIVEAKVSYPCADLHFMGHSNGTYLGAKALETYPMITFKRMMFAGSVVRTDYPWKDLVEQGRVEKIFNVVATKDWVVAAFPNGLRWFQRLFDLGGAGHNGFDEVGIPDALHQVDFPAGSKARFEYIEGGHSAAREEDLWDEIADFFVTGTTIKAGDHKSFEDDQPLWSRILGVAAPICVLILTALIVGLGVAAVTFTIASMTAVSAPAWFPDGAFFQTWEAYTAGTQLWILLGYVIALRFMALRF